MAKHVSIDDDLESFFNTVEDVRQSIRTTNATYHSELEPISSAVSSFSFGSWSDDVQKKLEECVNTTLGTNGVYAIEDDFGSGGFKQLMDCMDQLYNDSYMANENKKEYVRLKNKRDSEPEEKDGKKNPNRPSSTAVQNAKNDVEDVIKIINTSLLNLSKIVFGGTEGLETVSSPPDSTSSSSTYTGDTLKYASPGRDTMEASGVYASDGGSDRKHFTTYMDYLDSIRYRADDSYDYYKLVNLNLAEFGGNDASTNVYIAEFNYPPYVVDGVRQDGGDPIAMWKRLQTEGLQARSKYNQ